MKENSDILTKLKSLQENKIKNTGWVYKFKLRERNPMYPIKCEIELVEWVKQ